MMVLVELIPGVGDGMVAMGQEMTVAPGEVVKQEIRLKWMGN